MPRSHMRVVLFCHEVRGKAPAQSPGRHHERQGHHHLTAPGERAVKVGGEYIGLITRETEGWMWTGNRRAYRTFTLAAQALAERKSARP